MNANFIAISCPSCGSPDVFSVGGANYRCKHCEGTFIYKHAAPPPPRASAPPPPPQLTAPVASSYGPSPSAPGVVHVQPAAPRRNFAWLWTIFAVVLTFGGSGIAMVVSLFAQNAATPSTTPTVATPKPKPISAPVVSPTVKKSAYAAKAAPDDDEAEPAENSADAAALAPDLDAFQKLNGCSCRPGGGAAKLDLHVRADSSGARISAAGTQRQVTFSFAVGAAGREPTALQTSGTTSPRQSYPVGRFPLGVGCEGDTLVTASGERVTGWSLKDGSERWTHELDGSFGGIRSSENPSIDCKSLSTSKGVVTVRAGKTSARLNMADGEVAEAASARKPAKPTPAKPEPSKPEPAKPEPSKPDPAKPDPAKPEPPKPEPSKPNPAAGGKKKKKKKKGKKKKKKKKG